MIMENNILGIIPENQWYKLLDIFNKTSNIIPRTAIKTLIYNKELVPNFPVQIYALYNNPDEGIIIEYNLIYDSEICIFSPKDDCTILLSALKTSNILHDEKEIIVYNITHRLKKTFEDLIKDLNFQYDIYEAFVATIPYIKVETFKLKIPSDVYIDTVDSKFASEINANYAIAYPGLNMNFPLKVNYKIGLGIFGKNQGELRGWVFINTGGCLQALYIKDEFRRKGYARLLVKSMAKRLIQNEIEVLSTIVISNEASIRLFLNLGFKLTTVNYLYYMRHINKISIIENENKCEQLQ